MRYRLQHSTVYDYYDPVSACHNQAHLTLRELPWQHCHDAGLLVEPEPINLLEHRDYFGNRVTSFSVLQPHQRLTITSTAQVSVLPERRHRFDPTMPWQNATANNASLYDHQSLAAFQFAFDSFYITTSPTLADYARTSFPPDRPIAEAVADLNHRIHTEFQYMPGTTDIFTGVEQVLDARRGVCQDFAHLMIGALRSLGLSARYVSGYLRTDPPPGQPRLVGADATHAWVSVWAPGFGWMDFDPTNDCRPTDRHITLAWGRDFGDVSPVKGVILGGGRHDVSVAVDVVPANDEDDI